jgi:hypothetical protein
LPEAAEETSEDERKENWLPWTRRYKITTHMCTLRLQLGRSWYKEILVEARRGSRIVTVQANGSQ